MYNFVRAHYSTIESVSLYRGSRKVDSVAEVNWGCESNFVKAYYSILEIVTLYRIAVVKK